MSAAPVKEGDRQVARRTGTSTTQRLARSAALHPWRTVVAWGLVLVASVVVIATLIGSAFTSDGSLTTNPDSARAEKVIAQSFAQGDRIDEAVIVHSDRLTADTPRFRAFVADVLTSIEETGATEVVRDPYAPDQMAVSEDGQAVVLTMVLAHGAEAGIAEVLERVASADSDVDFDVTITGSHTLDHDFTELSESDLTNGELKFGLPAAMIVLVLVFGALVAAFIPMSIAIISIIVTVALSSILGQFTSLSFFIVNMITAMGLALGIDYSLFVLSRYREERQAGRDKIDAILTTGGTSGKAVLFSGSSFVVALLGLLLVPDTILRSLALGAIIVGLVTMAAALTLLPALLSLLGDRVNALRLPIVGRDHPAESPFWTRAVGGVVRRPGVALTLGVLVLLAAAYPVLGLRTGTAGVESLPDSSFARSGAIALERSFPGVATTDPAQVVVTGDVTSDTVTAAIERLEASVADDRDFGPPQRQVSEDGQVALVSIPLVGGPDHDQARRGLERLRSDLVPAAFDDTGTTVLVGGTTAQNVDYSDVINEWLPIVLAFVLGLSFVLLTLVFRSLVLSATAVVLNLLSVGAAYGLLVLVFQHGVGADLLGLQQVERVEAWVPIFLFSVLFALSMDYHVFLLSRIRERYAHTGNTEEAIVHGIAATGRIITGAALIIVVVFAGFAAGQLVMFQQMGFGVGVALLVDATLIRMVVVPAAMTLLGRWNWYLPGWLGWMPELHVEGDPAPAPPTSADVQPPVPALV
ncbi:putative drug exporter of the RND superfamily [Nocardioides alpinus]|uniref:MMPL family transporter n=1 Tax=Nocardioides alpinus TaxID=748909 RepID=A0A1I1AZG8_9ACTN|nr:MMPL family transporter [Nocardioides alpinus]PKH40889.1 MMPL family transporter [Nocardioides alpinus]SFB41653.1 putative drug exporter of the RND superfamily [Nocardioides alpinus]